MKAVLDTNVVVSGLLMPRGTCAEIIERLRTGDFALCLNWPILAEYDEVLHRAELPFPAKAVDDFLDFLRHRAEFVDANLLTADLPDESDRPFLEVALAAQAVLVTGNTRHFPPSASKGGRVVTPAEFLDLLRRAAKPGGRTSRA